MLAVINASERGAWEKVGGIPLLIRNLFYLKDTAHSFLILLSKEGSPEDIKEYKVTWRYTKGDPVSAIADLKEDFIYLDSSYLFDPRIIKKISLQKPNVIFLYEKERIILGKLNRTGLDIWLKEGEDKLIATSRHISFDDIERYCEELRGNIEPYVIRIKDREDAKNATFFLIKNMQKKVMDLPAEYIDPFFENLLTYLLCNSPITPNMVTFFGLAVAILIALLFLSGHLLIGAFCTYIVEVLDGVDGKLARTKLQFSKLGKYECLIDYFYENLWYLSIGICLKRFFHFEPALFFSFILILSDTVDNIVYTLSDLLLKKNLDLLSPFDMAFRKIAGRRNIYCFMFMIGFSLGYYTQTFIAASFWGFITALIHSIRLFQNLKLR